MTVARFVAVLAKDEAIRDTWCNRISKSLKADERAIPIGKSAAVVTNCRSPIALGDEGLIIGPIFERGRQRALEAADEDFTRAVIASRGEWLIRAHWGSYVAIIAPHRTSSVDVIRAPFGDLPCYMFRSSDGQVIGSDVTFLRRFALFKPSVVWRSVAHQLIAINFAQRDTCLQGLQELFGGQRLTGGFGRSTIEDIWTPWEFACSSKMIADPAEAALRVRSAVQLAVAAQSQAHRRVLLKLSGGLDSSIVAAALAHAQHSFTALTLVSSDAAGDERGHARAVAAHFGVDLIEADRRLDLVDLEVSAANDLPNPLARGFIQASQRTCAMVARAAGASAVIDGAGGDNMFALLESPAPVIDCFPGQNGEGHFWQTARSIGIATQSSTLEVARRAVKRRRHGPAYRWACDRRFMSSDAASAAADGWRHPWLTPPEDAAAGSAAHIGLLTVTLSGYAQHRHAPITELSPLISQPVAEACLRVPSWRWTRDGHNRVVARDAFRSVLPPGVVDRRDKGAPDGFLVTLLESHRALARDMLLGGILMNEGLLDAASLTDAFKPSAMARGSDSVRLMQLIDAEAWTRLWCC